MSKSTSNSFDSFYMVVLMCVSCWQLQRYILGVDCRHHISNFNQRRCSVCLQSGSRFPFSSVFDIDMFFFKVDQSINGEFQLQANFTRIFSKIISCLPNDNLTSKSILMVFLSCTFVLKFS